jgi:hypothetical protein
MTDIRTVLEEAVSGEPPIGFRPAEVLERGRRARRRRRGAALAAMASGAGVTAAVVALTAGSASPAGHAPGLAGGRAGHTKLSLAALETAAAARARARPSVSGLTPRTARITVDGIAAGRAAGLVQRATGVRLAQVQVSVLGSGRPGSQQDPFIDLGAGVAVPGHPYFNLQVSPAGTLITKMPTCAELSDLSSGNGDGYYGPCRIQRLAGGSLLIVRSGRTTSGGFTMAQATLIRPDGSGFFAEDTNQTWTVPARIAKRGHASGKQLPPVVRAQPPVGAGVLDRLVRSLAALSATG